MGEWLKNPGTGENPIPGVKAGGFELWFSCGAISIAAHDAYMYYWERRGTFADILEYRLIDPN